MLRGDVALTLTLPRGFEESIVRDRAASVHLDVNAEKGSAANVVQSYALQVINAYAAELSAERTPAAANAPAIRTVARDWYNPTLDYKHYMVPGILVALVTIIGTLVTAQNIAREKELGTLEQLNVTPITKAEFITAKLLPFWVLALVDLGIGLAVGYFVFHVPMRGNPVLLFLSAGVYLIVALGIGLVDLDARGDAAAGDVRDVLRVDDLSVDEWVVHAGREHAAVGAGVVVAQSRAAFRHHLSRHTHQGGGVRRDHQSAQCTGCVWVGRVDAGGAAV